MKVVSDISNDPFSLRKTTEQSRIAALSVPVHEGNDKQQSSDPVFESKPVDSSLVGIGMLKNADPREDLAKMKSTDGFQVPVQAETSAVEHEKKILPNEDDVDNDRIKPKRIRKKKKKLVKIKMEILVPNFKLLQEYPGSYFIAARCKGCFFVSTFHSHPRHLVVCPRCCMCLCFPGEKAGDRGKLTVNCSFWAKTDKIIATFIYDDDLPANFPGRKPVKMLS